MNTLKDLDNVAVDDVWIYTTPTGRHIRYTVVSVDARPKYQHKPGPCLKLIAKDGNGTDCIMWPEDLGEYYWSQEPAPPSAEDRS